MALTTEVKHRPSLRVAGALMKMLGFSSAAWSQQIISLAAIDGYPVRAM